MWIFFDIIFYMNKKLILTVLASFLLAGNGYAKDYVKNDLRTLFLNNEAVIYEINMRTFNADDKNGNGIIDFDKGETSGNFINAIERLDELEEIGINTIHLMPINPVGKKKALGTVGSLYAMSKIADIDNNLADKNSKLSVKEQAKLFISECHKRNIRVMVDLPACASFEMTETNPELFLKKHRLFSNKEEFITPVDWSDVRLLKIVNRDGSLYNPVLNEHKKYVDMLLDIGADGIRADVAPIKPAKFWTEIINYARSKDPEFMFLAETAEAWAPPKVPSPTSDYKALLAAGFDGYYGNCLDFTNFKTVKDFEKVFKHINELAKNGEKKAIIGCFDTHDLKSAFLISKYYPQTVMYMNATLPLNPYYVDGFVTGDKYDYQYSGKLADKTFSDNQYYFTHPNQIDIFNYSRRPGGDDTSIKDKFNKTLALRKDILNVIQNGEFKFLKSTNKKIFIYEISKGEDIILVAVNSDQEKHQYVEIKRDKDFKNKIQRTRVMGYTENSCDIWNDKTNSFHLLLPPGHSIVMWTH